MWRMQVCWLLKFKKSTRSRHNWRFIIRIRFRSYTLLNKTSSLLWLMSKQHYNVSLFLYYLWANNITMYHYFYITYEQTTLQCITISILLMSKQHYNVSLFLYYLWANNITMYHYFYITYEQTTLQCITISILLMSKQHYNVSLFLYFAVHLRKQWKTEERRKNGKFWWAKNFILYTFL